MSEDQHVYPSSSNLGAIVARMQERAVVVTKEEDELQLAKESLELVQQEAREVSTKRRDVRATYLKMKVDRSKVELGSIRTAKDIELKEKQIDTIKQITARIVEQHEEDVKQWETGIHQEVLEHRVRRKLYLNYLESTVTAKEEAIQKRTDRLALVRELEEDQKLAIQQLRERAHHIRTAELPEAKERHGEANTHAETLAKQVREAIENRSSIRDKLRERQAHYENVQKQSDDLAAEYRS